MNRFLEQCQAVLAPLADAKRAPAMRAYMRDQFPFLGIAAPVRRMATRKLVRQAVRELDEPALLALARSLWALPEREYQYVAVDLLIAGADTLTPNALPALIGLALDKPWWDSLDGLTSWCIGGLVQRYRELQPIMDRCSRDPSLWARRIALLHQLRWRSDTDTGRLFRYCVEQADDKEFFIRKAIGWALREYAWTDPEAVRAFVQSEQQRLSPLSRREALKNLLKETQ